MNTLPDKHACFDLIVCGQIARDFLSANGETCERIGGIAYAASTAAKLGSKVGLVATITDPRWEEIIAELRKRDLDCTGVYPRPSEPLIYRIDGADEVVDQRTLRTGPLATDLAFPQVPDKYLGASVALLYPVNLQSCLVAALHLKKSGTKIAFDLQHDVDNLEDFEKLSSIADYVFLNSQTLLRLTQSNDIGAAVEIIRKSTQAPIIVKMGMAGSLIYENGCIGIPSFLSDFGLTVGAGDAYDAVFLTSILRGDKISQAGMSAALHTAAIIESTDRDPSTAILREEALSRRQPVFLAPEVASAKLIYIAGHFHSRPLETFILEIANAVERLGFRTYVPHRDTGVVGPTVSRQRAYNGDMDALHNAAALIGLLDGAGRGGTFFEIGASIERGVPVIAICTDPTQGVSNMVFSSCYAMDNGIKPAIVALVRLLGEYAGDT